MNSTRVRAATCLAVLAASFFLPALARAQDVVMTSNPDKWQFSVLLYGWLPTIKGSVSFPLAGAGGSVTADPNEILNNLNLAAMGSFGVTYNRWGFFTDAMYMNIGHTKTGYRDFTLPNQEPASLTASVNLTIKALIVTSALSYKLVEQPDFALSGLAGVRYLGLKPSLSYYFSADLMNNPTIPRGGERSLSTNWTDAIVGFKGQWTFGDSHRWGLPFYADVGGGDSKLTWQLAGGIDYHLGSWEVGLLYRKLNYHLNSSGMTDMSVSGPMLGGLYRW